ncbi:TonB-dependent receptor [Rufibacter latericius]|uniref:TonB-dependent receptor n=1 Tax=Rufibacter latericius TaxID=2487040 RepID=A0A3M9ML11_9BACT|nr:TonB-dependent receptor [Rufibacter latericius]RNI26224.1 TonB-dependent receptor [Rufibacter latericius]
MRSFLLTLSFICMALVGFAQTGTLTGKVKDKKTGEAIIGATVSATTSNVAATDLEGNYSLSLAPGTYKVTITYVSYKPLTFETVTIEAGKTTTLNSALEDDAHSLGEVTVVAERQVNNDVSLIKDIKQSNIVVSGMSNEQIVKAQDRDAAEAVRRIPGVTIQDNRFIIVRGLSERYNSVMLNNVLTPSSEVDVRAFSFDVLPTSVIDRILIYKSPAPELPGDFAGGAIKVTTRNAVTENSATFNIGMGYRTGTTFNNNYYSYKGSKTDFLGFDSGTRQLPGNFPSTAKFQSLSYTERAQYGQNLDLPNTWKPEKATAAPDLRLNFGLNRVFDVAGNRVSSITAVTYSNARLRQNTIRSDYQQQQANGDVDTNWNYTDQLSGNTVRVGLLQNFSLRLNENNKIEFRNLFNQIGITQTTVRQGFNYETGSIKEEQNYALRYESRSIYTGQLQGTHSTPDQKNTFTWSTGYNFINRQEPDLRRVRTQRDAGSEGPFRVQVSTLSTPYDAARFFSDLNESAYIAEGQWQHLFNAADSTDVENAPKLNIGFYAERKDRDFNARTLNYKRNAGIGGGRTDENILNQPLDQIFAPGNLSFPNGLIFDEGTTIADKYDASNTLGAAYAGISKKFFDKVNFYGGVRTEYNWRQVTTADQSGTYEVDEKKLYILPSVNVAYNFSLRSLLRVAYGMTVNRPEFREQARFSFYDFNENASVRGNNELKTATIHNLDMRYEFYPSSAELLSLGVFYKRFINPIETKLEAGTGTNYTFVNGKYANSIGVEAEARKSFREVFGSKFLQNHSLVLNASLIHSRVNLGDEASGEATDRPMMGQSPYIVNTGLYYQDEETGWQYSIMYNVLGTRVYRVGDDQNPTIYELPRHVVDVTFTKNFKNRMQVKAGVTDLLNQKFRFKEDTNQDGDIGSADLPIYLFNRGMYSTITLGYTF